MQDMTTALDRIVEHLRRLDRGVPERLQKGLSKEELESTEAKLPFALTRELETMYQWRNGTRAEPGALLESLYFFPGFYFVSMDEAVQTLEEREDSEQWREGWFPVFANGAGDFYVVPCQEKKIDAAEVIGFLHGEPEQTAEYESLTAMAYAIEACFREKAFYLDEHDTMEIDDQKQREIARRFNPTIREWQS